jgi:hypothetical protein
MMLSHLLEKLIVVYLHLTYLLLFASQLCFCIFHVIVQFLLVCKISLGNSFLHLLSEMPHIIFPPHTILPNFRCHLDACACIEQLHLFVVRFFLDIQCHWLPFSMSTTSLSVGVGREKVDACQERLSFAFTIK